MKTVTLYVIEQSVFTGRQITFDILRHNNNKIGMNTQANKFYYIMKLIGLDKLNLSFVHYKKLMKIAPHKRVVITTWPEPYPYPYSYGTGQ